VLRTSLDRRSDFATIEQLFNNSYVACAVNM
jgi:hypothetical protein